MKILFDLTAAQSNEDTKNHGAMEYCITVFFKLINEANADTIIEAIIDPNNSINSYIIDICAKYNLTIHHCKSNYDLNNILKEKYDNFYSAMPYKYTNIVIPKTTLFIYTIHGLRDIEIYTDKYQHCYSKINFILLVKKIILSTKINLIKKHYLLQMNNLINITTNKKIIAVSNHTKYALLNYYPELNRDEIQVLYSPSKICMKSYFQNEENIILKKYSLISKKYILLISGNRWIKNCIRGCIAIDNLISNKIDVLQDVKVVVLGANYQECYIKNIKNTEKFMLVSTYVEDAELEILYKNAHLLLYPTLNEGFGYPPLEAMKYGTLAAVSAICSLTEIYSNAALYFNPYDVDEIANRVLQSFDINIVNEKKVLIENICNNIFNRQENDLQLLVDMILAK